MQFHYNAAFKCLKSTTKTQGKDVKFVPGGVGGRVCLVGNFSRTIAGEQLSRDLVDISMDISGG